VSNPLTILFKYPSRSRPEYFFESLDTIYSCISDSDNFHVACTFDDDDVMVDIKNIAMVNSYKNLSIQSGLSENKIHAINRDMPAVGDIIVVMSDDMKFTFYGFDEIIRQQFSDGDLDKLIHFPDNDAKEALATMYIAGRTYYERFGYVYHPSYKSVWADNEVQEVAKRLGKYRFADVPGMIFHANPAYGHRERDEMFNRQQDLWDADYGNFMERQKNNFYL
jgi:hypothetical protein